jgi:predicted XRE-type DNA-binding protein
MDVKLFLQLYGINRQNAAKSLHLSQSSFNRKLRERSFTGRERQKLFNMLKQTPNEF